MQVQRALRAGETSQQDNLPFPKTARRFHEWLRRSASASSRGQGEPFARYESASRDRATVDRKDKVRRNCEKVRVK